MSSKFIKFRINKKTGALTLQTEGFQGAECLEATKKIVEDLGLTGEVEKTTEFYQEQPVEQQQNLGS
jgi:valyl-tRNA synthetase